MTIEDFEACFPEDLGIRLIDLMRDPELIIKKIQSKLCNAKIICLNCKKFMTFKFTKNFYSFKCNCGIHIFYPPRKDRDFAYAHKFVSFEEFKEMLNKGVELNGCNGKTA